MKKTQSYTIMAKPEVECDVDIMAESPEDALARSKALKLEDFVEVKGQLIGDSLHIKGLFED